MADYPVTESDIRIAKEPLTRMAQAIFAACGMSAENARLLASSLVHADLRGVHSHGVLRIPDYVHKLVRGGVDPAAIPFVVSSRRGSILVDGNNNMGQIGASFAMDLAMESASQNGIALAALRGSNHCGALDWYTLRAARNGMIGIVGSNALPTMAPIGGRDKIVGMNPVSIAIPALKEEPVVMDLAFGATAHGKIRVYHQKGLPIPGGWALDENGNPTTDAAIALDGLIQPAGGHKGMALAMMVGMLSTLLSGASYGTALGDMVNGPVAGRDGQFFIAIDIAAFRNPDDFGADVDEIVRQVHNSTPIAPGRDILVPGEMERQHEEEYGLRGIILPRRSVKDIVATARELGLDTSGFVELP